MLQPESQRGPKISEHPSSPRAKKFKDTPSARQVMLTVFWDSEGVMLTDFQEKWNNVNTACIVKFY